jgi:ketosteroid isomerase-like protein
MNKPFYVMIVVVMVITACQSKNKIVPVNTLADADAIRSLENQGTIFYQTKNLDKYMDLYSTEAVFMMPNEQIFVGTGTIRKKIESQFADSTNLWEKYSWTIDKIEVSSSGDLAYVRGTSRESKKIANGIVEEMGKGIDVFKKENGEWKVVLSIWNSDKPLAGK